MTKRMHEIYQKEAVPKMMAKFGLKNKHEVPRVEKVVLNTGFGKIIGAKAGDEAKKVIDEATNNLALISGQKPSVCPARKSIAGFKLRKGLPIGVKVTLRGPRMYDFLERLVHIVLPRSRDFRGIEQKGFDQNGNLNIGIKEVIFFPEILPEKVRNQLSLEITVQNSAKSKEQGVELLRLLGFPIQ